MLHGRPAIATINKLQEQSLLYVTFHPIFHTEPRLTVDPECILMKDFLFDSCQTFYHARPRNITNSQRAYSPTLGLKWKVATLKADFVFFLFFWNGSGPRSRKVAGVVCDSRPGHGSLILRLVKPQGNESPSVFTCSGPKIKSSTG